MSDTQRKGGREARYPEQYGKVSNHVRYRKEKQVKVVSDKRAWLNSNSNH